MSNNKPTIIADFPECPVCHSTETVSSKGMLIGIGDKSEKYPFSHLEQKLVPIEQPVMAGVMVKAILTHYDVCYKCGTYRCTRAELVSVPVQAGPGQKMPGMGMPPM